MLHWPILVLETHNIYKHFWQESLKSIITIHKNAACTPISFCIAVNAYTCYANIGLLILHFVIWQTSLSNVMCSWGGGFKHLNRDLNPGSSDQNTDALPSNHIICLDFKWSVCLNGTWLEMLPQGATIPKNRWINNLNGWTKRQTRLIPRGMLGGAKPWGFL